MQPGSKSTHERAVLLAAQLCLLDGCVIFSAKGAKGLTYIRVCDYLFTPRSTTFLFSLRYELREHAAAIDHHTADLQINSYVESTGNIQFYVHVGGYQSLPLCALEEELQNTGD